MAEERAQTCRIEVSGCIHMSVFASHSVFICTHTVTHNCVKSEVGEEVDLKCL